jgi:SAM-dependent methyltransferase
MGQILSQEQIETLEASLQGDTGKTLLTMMKSLSLRSPDGAFDPEAVQCALNAKLVRVYEQGRPVLTPLGWLVSDSIREYAFWLERDRRLPLSDVWPHFADRAFRGKRVLELGCGTGCNLFSIQAIASNVVGIEIEPVYAQMTPILAELAGIEAPAVLIGPAEHLPFDDASQDVVIAIGSMQFMDFKQVLAEVNRVLDAGGFFIASFSPLTLFVGYEMREAMKAKNFKRFLRTFLVVANTFHEQWLGRRPSWLQDRNPLNRAVYPTRNRMRSLLLEAGLVPDYASSQDHMHQRIYVARRPD